MQTKLVKDSSLFSRKWSLASYWLFLENLNLKKNFNLSYSDWIWPTCVTKDIAILLEDWNLPPSWKTHRKQNSLSQEPIWICWRWKKKQVLHPNRRNQETCFRRHSTSSHLFSLQATNDLTSEHGLRWQLLLEVHLSQPEEQTPLQGSDFVRAYWHVVRTLQALHPGTGN
jgi:hypothetical protein